MKSKRHIRHESSARNRRKMAHFVGNALDELDAMGGVLAKLDDMARYLRGRLNRIRVRLNAERMKDHDR
jgi:hypothetical protein